MILLNLIARNTKLFFKDKGTFLTALIAPLIILMLFVTFLGNIYTDSFISCIPEGITVPDSLTNGFVGGWLLSSLLAVCLITVPFTANMIMVQDKVNGIRNDMTIAPVKTSTLAISYYVSTLIVSLIICYITVAVGFIYLAIMGWYLSVGDVFIIILDVFVMSMFGTALSSFVCGLLKSQGGITAVTTIVSAIYGFLCGAYMPINSFGAGIQKFIKLLPGTYGTSLLHNHYMGSALNELANNHFPQEVVNGIRDGFDLNVTIAGQNVEIYQMYLIIIGSCLLLIGAYVLLSVLKRTKKTA